MLAKTTWNLGEDSVVMDWFSCTSKILLIFILLSKIKQNKYFQSNNKIINFPKFTIETFNLGQKYPDQEILQSLASKSHEHLIAMNEIGNFWQLSLKPECVSSIRVGGIGTVWVQKTAPKK